MQGILMKPDMIQATVERRKTNTRRLMNPQPKDPHDISFNGKLTYREKITYPGGYYLGEWQHIRPRYHVGETVYIKEAWCPLITPVYNLLDPTIPTVYKQEMDAGGATLPKEFKWKSPRSMPEWAARHFILMEAISGERLQEITIAGAVAEGVPCQELGIKNDELCRAQFADLWDSINPAYPFDSNPWVWAYQFRLEIHE